MPPLEKSASEGRHPQRRIAKSSYSLRSCCKKLRDQNEIKMRLELKIEMYSIDDQMSLPGCM